MVFTLDLAIRYHFGAVVDNSDRGAGAALIEFERGELTTDGPGMAGEPEPVSVTDTLEHPAFDGMEIFEISARNGKGVEVSVRPQEAFLAHRYAYSRAGAADQFDMRDDPVGEFVDVERDPATLVDHTRYEHVDVHRKNAGGEELLYLTPKNSDARIETSAIASCSRKAGGAALYSCHGSDFTK